VNEDRTVNEDLYIIEPPFYNIADEYAALIEELAELEEFEEFEENIGKPNYRLLDEIPLEELPF